MPTFKKTFDSISDIATYINTTPIHKNCRANASSDMAKDNSWALGLDLKGAATVAAQGGYWEEGAKQMQSVTLNMKSLIDSRSVPAVEHSVAGFMPDVPAYLAGIPQNMLCMSDEGVGRNDKVVRVVVHVGRKFSCDASAIVNRGAAIMSIVDEIENAGARAEVVAVWANQSSYYQSDFQTMVKSAGEPWSPHSVAFALCHPAFNRRLMWRVLETFGDAAPMMPGYGSGWGYEPTDCDVYFPYMGRGPEWSTPKGALATAAQIFDRSVREAA